MAMVLETGISSPTSSTVPVGKVRMAANGGSDANIGFNFVPKGTGALTCSGDFATSVAGKGLKIKEGTNARMGTATLTAGAATVSNTSVTASSRIFLTSNTDGGTPGWLRVSARTAGTSFTITSSSGTDTGTVAWVMYEPAP